MLEPYAVKITGKFLKQVSNMIKLPPYQLSVIIGLILSDSWLIFANKTKSYFGVGTIPSRARNGIQYQVTSLHDIINVIIPHFNKYPLKTQKKADLILFKQIVNLMINKEHLTNEGLYKIVAIKASMNLGLSDELKKAFPNIVPVPRPLVVDQVIKSPHWVAGFTSGEGCFIIHIYKSDKKLGETVKLVFHITQHNRDEQLMNNLISYFKAGKCYNIDQAVDLRVIKFSDLTNIIIPFFCEFPIIGVKAKDFEDFKQVVELIKNKAHLTSEGLEKIRLIKAGMNKGRV